jgi:hypothetical protein
MTAAGERSSWRATQHQAAIGLDGRVSETLAQIARESWGEARGRSWQIVATLVDATWHLYHLTALPRGARGFRFQQLGVRATVAPDGDLVAFQVDNGVEFLALADTSSPSLQRGLRHLITKGLPELQADQPPFRPGGGGLLDQVRRLIRREG